MEVPAERLLSMLRVTLDRLLGPADGYASDEEAVRSALTVLINRQQGGIADQRHWLGKMADEIDALARLLGLATRAADLASDAAALATRIRASTAADSLEALENAARQLTPDFARLTARMTADPRLDAETRQKAAASVVRWELARNEARIKGRGYVAPQGEDQITADNLGAYLADRFKEPGMKVTELRALAGGFGKQTILFSVSGQALSGDFVMRRDRDEPTLENDCHRIDREYPVIRAAFKHGFPAPDALWLDTEHRLLPGGDFIVMRRAPGSPGGSVFSADASISDDLLTVLATSLARLHALPPLTELGDLTDSINAEMWSLSLREAAKRYIEGFRSIYLKDVAEPSPAILSLYSWVLDNLPDPAGRPVLCHGDVGFHNMVLQDGKLSVLVDWEFAHVGDPAEDLAYVRNTAGDTLDWDRFLAVYRQAGGADVDPQRIKVFQIWGQLRNATASAATINCFVTGKLDELKLAHTGFFHFPGFMGHALGVLES